MSYVLAVDVGTSRIAAATSRIAADGSIVTAPFALGRRSDSVATVVFVAEDGELFFGDVAERRGLTQPERLVREFKRSIGDEVPLVVGGRSLPAEQLYARTVAAIVELVSEREGQRPEVVSLTHPTAWGAHRLELLRAALRQVEVDNVELITEPEAAARHYEATRSLEVGQTLAVYDLGGGTFDSVILQKEADGSFGLVGDPVGIDNLGGADFDDAVMRHAVQASNLDVSALDVEDPDTRVALSQLRRECVEAKEALSFDSEATIPVLVPPVQTSVRLTRSEFEEMIDGSLDQTIDAFDDSVEAAGLQPEQLESILLIGGSSRIPRVAQRLSERIDRPIAIDADPKASIALGAARTALVRLNDRYLAAPSTTLALLNPTEGAGALALVDDEAAVVSTAPNFVAPNTKLRKSSPFVLGGAAVVIAAAIVFASTLTAGSGDGRMSPAASTPTPSVTTAAPVAPIDAPAPAPETAPAEKSESAPDRGSNAPANPRRSAVLAAPKSSSPSPKPTSPPSSATAPSQQTGSSATTPTESIPTPAPTTPTADPSDPPVEPSDPPVEPSDPPVEPTDPPVEPTDPPVEPTDPPVEPTDPPVEPTDPPVEPTVEPTDPPIEPAPEPSPSPTDPV